MKTGRKYINTILLLAGMLAATLLAGCATSKDKDKEYSLVKLHAESDDPNGGFSRTVPIYRASPVYVNVDESAFLDENDLVRAAVLEDNGFEIELDFNEHGVLLLENITRANPGRRIAIFCEFGQERWLAAPVFVKAVTNGKIVFTPDATREEAERIVRGLNNEVEKLKQKS
jgi:preprotein translocase subunit SecD